jgi:hypothetical protein
MEFNWPVRASPGAEAAATMALQGVPWRGWREWGDAPQSGRAPCVVDHVLKLSLVRVLSQHFHFAHVPPWPSMRCHDASRAGRLSRQGSAGREGGKIETVRPPFRWFMPAGINPERMSPSACAASASAAWTSHSYSGDRRARRVFLLCALLLTTGSWAPARSTAEAEAQVIRVESRSRPAPSSLSPWAIVCRCSERGAAAWLRVTS